jgi:alpha-D-ribose 1-methylphosphonate 5-triphosphate synthase subunit PhnH
MNNLSTLPGFSNPVDDAQAVFRAVLGALSSPGTPVLLAAQLLPLTAAGFSLGMQALALALCDSDTPIWLDDAADTPEARHYLRFHCASPFAANPSEASFAFIANAESMPRLHGFDQGKPVFPDRSAMLIINANLFGCRGQARELTGPGVKNSNHDVWQSFHISGLPAWFWEDWEANHASYPLGVDIVFVDTGTDDSGALKIRLLGLPRTARVRQAARSPAQMEHAACM